MKTLETTEINKNDSLLTRWYENDYDQCILAIRNIAKKNNYKIVSINDDFFEVLVESDSFTSILRISSITPRKTAIDLCVSSKSFFKKPINQIDIWYEELNRNLTFLKKGRE